MAVRAFVFVDRHGSARLAPSLRGTRAAGTSPARRRAAPPHLHRLVALALLATLVLPAGAAAHATLLRTVPANGAVLDRAPSVVRVVFDDGVRVAPGNAAVANSGGASVLGGAARTSGRVLLLPLRPQLAKGAYSVRWSIVSDDGHREEGLVAFAVGRGAASPSSVLRASAGLGSIDFGLRALYYLGLLGGAGAAAFALATRGLASERLRRPLAHLLFFSLLATFVGASAIVHAAPPGTRFALVLKIALTTSLVGGAAAALAPTYPALIMLAGTCALALLGAPTLSGHSLDRDQPRGLAAVVDLAHATSAAVWFGGLLALAFVVPAATDESERRALARRFSTVALGAVIVLGLTGLGRAVTELSAVSQVWSTSYGRALIAKSALFIPLLGVGWLNRSLLAGAFARLRRSVLVEVTVLTAIVVVVGVLTDLRPGKLVRPIAAAAAVQSPGPPPLPPAAAVVAARELGTLAVAVARVPGEATVTLLAGDGTATNGRAVQIDGEAAQSCGPGCYRAAAADGPVHVSVGGRTLTFDTPVTAPDGRSALARITRAYRRAKTIVFDENLRSSPSNAQTTRFTVVAPDRLSYVTRGGPGGIVIGSTRWDRTTPGGAWLRTAATRLDVTHPYWRSARNVHLIEPGVLTFFDPSIPAWFRLEVRMGHLQRLGMTAAAHFMVDRYVGFDGPASVSPPPSR
jgi:copper transport protein